MASVKYEYFDDYKRKLNEEDTFKEALKDYYDLVKSTKDEVCYIRDE